MSQRPFRFIHSGDLHLEHTLQGVTEVPDHLREIFLESRYISARRVFDAALFEGAAFLILCGDVLQPFYTGPRGIVFLREQFARLAEREISVYWVGGEVDPPEAWPAALDLPRNIHVFPRGRVDEFVQEYQGEAVARLLGTSRDKQSVVRAGDFHPDPSGLLTIAAAYGSAEPAALHARGINYWALGGRHERAIQSNTPSMIHYCGAPQGGRPEESGVHGCTLVEVDEHQQIKTSLIPTDSVRWVNERIVIDRQTNESDLETLLRERMHSLRESAAQVHLLITWRIAGEGALVKQLRSGRLSVELLERLRNEYGYALPAAWSLSIQVETADHLPADWYEQETMRGDFLREIRRLQMNFQEPLELEAYLCERHQSGTLGAAAQLADETSRRCVLSEAAHLGAALLGGDAETKEEVPA